MANNSQLTWALLTGEYPPAAGGVAGYTAQLVAALLAAGDAVHVWAPAPATSQAGEHVHPLPGVFGARARRQLQRELAALPAAQPLIQYVPHAYGRRGMNLGFCRWAAELAPAPWIMFHEVAYPREPGQPLRHRLLAAVTRRMAAQLQRAAGRSFVAIPAWGTWLEQLAPGSAPPQWLPVPSNLPDAVGERAWQAARTRAGAGPATLVVGWFGGRVDAYTRATLTRVLAPLLTADPHRRALLSGSGGPELRRAVTAAAPALAGRITAPGVTPAPETAAQLAACDLMLQPYPDGISSRRGSAMAALALARPLVSTCGYLSERFWRDSPAVMLVETAAAEEMTAAAEALLRDESRRQVLGESGRALYRARFALPHTVAALRAAAGAPSPAALEAPA